jgi:hypothetical protein
VRQMRERGVNAVLLAGDGSASDEFAAIGLAAQGTFMTFTPDPRNRPDTAKVVREFKAREIAPASFYPKLARPGRLCSSQAEKSPIDPVKKPIPVATSRTPMTRSIAPK